MSTAPRRVKKELAHLDNNPIEGITIEPGITIDLDEDNLYHLNCKIKADAESPYKNGTFHFTLALPEKFPFIAPVVNFTTKIYHPGINHEGHICLPILQSSEWLPTVSLLEVLVAIKEKLNQPSPDDELVPEIAAQLKNDNSRFLSIAEDWTKEYAS